MRAVYAIAHHLQQQASKRLVCWLSNNARWDDQQYTDWVIPLEFRPEGYRPAWCHDIHLLRQAPTCKFYLCVCGWVDAPSTETSPEVCMYRHIGHELLQGLIEAAGSAALIQGQVRVQDTNCRRCPVLHIAAFTNRLKDV